MSDLHWAPDSRRFAFSPGDARYQLYTATTDGAAPVLVTTASAGLGGSGDQWTWATQGFIVPDSGARAFLLVDPSSGQARPLASTDAMSDLYRPVLSPDGRTLIVKRGSLGGLPDEVWQRRLDGGAWERMLFPSISKGEPTPLRWDDSGIYAEIRFLQPHPPEIWRARSPGAPFAPLLTGLRWCTGSAPSLSDDNQHLVCRERTTTASDVWLISGLEPAARQ